MNLLTLSFLDTYSPSMASLVINFLVHWFIRLSSSFVHFKNGLQYLISGSAWCLSLWWDFCCRDWFRPGNSYFFFHVCLFDNVRFEYSQVLVIFFLPSAFSFFLFASSIPSVISLLSLYIINIAHFSILNFIPISWLCILIVCIRISNSFSFFVNSLMSSMS